MKRWTAIALLCLATAAGAQTAAPAPAPAAAPAPLPSSPAKKELVAKILLLQQGGIDTVATRLAQQPALQLMQRAGNVLQANVPADKREAVAKDVQADLKKYMDETVPLLRERAQKLAPGTIGTLLEERFTEDELKQVIAIIESPVNRKYQQLNGEMEKVLVEKIVADSKGVVDPKIRTLEQSIAGHLGIKPEGAAAPAAATTTPAARPPARPASSK